MQKLPTCLLLFFCTFLLVACSSDGGIDGGIDVSCDEFYDTQQQMSETKVEVGEEFSLTLCSNPSTGFIWSEEADISDGGVLQQVSHEFVLPEEKDEPPPPGTPGQEIWTFEALRSGNSTITVEYSRPWEGGEKREWTFTLTVEVE